MVVVVLTACPAGLRGHLTRWLLEIAPGIFVGKISARVRQELWARVLDLSKDGRALMVFTKKGDQGLDFLSHRHDWTPEDFDGIRLVRRPPTGKPSTPTMRPGWSKASHIRRARTK
ncbi:MAG: type I-E CRISPR-associated endoribonuclease Cas2 [Micropruina sp.]|nr:type I-E CRISPR-associated endoribonuclease Cas2 [Micropruina sp.]